MVTLLMLQETAVLGTWLGSTQVLPCLPGSSPTPFSLPSHLLARSRLGGGICMLLSWAPCIAVPYSMRQRWLWSSPVPATAESQIAPNGSCREIEVWFESAAAAVNRFFLPHLAPCQWGKRREREPSWKQESACCWCYLWLSWVPCIDTFHSSQL